MTKVRYVCMISLSPYDTYSWNYKYSIEFDCNIEKLYIKIFRTFISRIIFEYLIQKFGKKKKEKKYVNQDLKNLIGYLNYLIGLFNYSVKSFVNN